MYTVKEERVKKCTIHVKCKMANAI
jgi:hypothetical protein